MRVGGGKGRAIAKKTDAGIQIGALGDIQHRSDLIRARRTEGKNAGIVRDGAVGRCAE